MQSLAFSSHVTQLKFLSLRNNKLNNQGFHNIMTAQNMKQLVELIVEYNEISEDGSLAITASPYFTNLEQFNIA